MSPKGVGERPDQDLGPPMETDVSVRVLVLQPSIPPGVSEAPFAGSSLEV